VSNHEELCALRRRISDIISQNESAVQAQAETSRAQTSALLSSLESEVSKAQESNASLERDKQDAFDRLNREIMTLLDTTRSRLAEDQSSRNSETEALLRKLEYEVQCSVHIHASLTEQVRSTDSALDAMRQRISDLVSQSESAIQAELESARAQTSALLSSLESDVSKAQESNASLERDKQDAFDRLNREIMTLLDTTRSRLAEDQSSRNSESEALLRKLENEIQGAENARQRLDQVVELSNGELEALRQRMADLVSQSESAVQADPESGRAPTAQLISFLESEVETAREHNSSIDRTKTETFERLNTDITALLVTARARVDQFAGRVAAESESLLRKLEYEVQCCEATRHTIEQRFAPTDQDAE
jgi:hypothetical protein